MLLYKLNKAKRTSTSEIQKKLFSGYYINLNELLTTSFEF